MGDSLVAVHYKATSQSRYDDQLFQITLKKLSNNVN